MIMPLTTTSPLARARRVVVKAPVPLPPVTTCW